MSKLKTELSYIVRCGHCNKDETFTLRASNVNTGITDEDAYRLAREGVGRVESGYCESCRMFTQMTTVAYNLPTAREAELMKDKPQELTMANSPQLDKLKERNNE